MLDNFIIRNSPQEIQIEKNPINLKPTVRRFTSESHSY